MTKRTTGSGSDAVDGVTSSSVKYQKTGAVTPAETGTGVGMAGGLLVLFTIGLTYYMALVCTKVSLAIIHCQTTSGITCTLKYLEYDC